MVSRRLRYAATVLLLSGGFSGAHAADAPCCHITSIDKKTGIVTALDAKTKQPVRFKVDNAVLLNRVALNQKVSVDREAGRASVEGIQGRFRLVPAAAAPGNRAGSAATARPPTATGSSATNACCAITDIDAKRGLVAARETASGRAFSFAVNDAGLLRSLRVGQPVHAHFASGQVSLDGRKPCCRIAATEHDAKAKSPAGGNGPLAGTKGTAAEQPARTRAPLGTGRNIPASGEAGDSWEQSGSTADAPGDSTPASAQDGYSETPADAWPGDSGSGFPSGSAETGYPADDGGYASFPEQPAGTPAEPPPLDGGKSYSYGSGEAPLQGDVPWWKQPPQ